MSLVSHYKDVPVSNRVGAGVYTYKCVWDSEEFGITKVEVFANSLPDAVNMAAIHFGVYVAGYNYIGEDIVSLVLPNTPGTMLVYV